MRTLGILILLVLSAVLAGAQMKPAAVAGHPNNCNQMLTFCWYGPYQDGSDEADAWGTLWKSDDPSEKSIEQNVEVRCIKRLGVCIQARNEKALFGGPTTTNIDLYQVRSWDGTEIRAVMDENFASQCEQTTLVINRVDRSAMLISSPGPKGNDKQCTGLMGTPKTVIYRLSFPEKDSLIGLRNKGK